MSIVAVEAKPLSRMQIRDYATKLREILGLQNQMYVDVERLIDIILPQVLPGFHYDVRTYAEMGEKHGEADPSEVRISLREDVYDGMVKGMGRDRLTTLHEIAHLLLHTPDRIVLNRRGGIPPAYRDPEWQANCLAGEFLGSHLFVGRCRSADEFAQKTGISYQAAAVQWKACADYRQLPDKNRKAN